MANTQLHFQQQITGFPASHTLTQTLSQEDAGLSFRAIVGALGADSTSVTSIIREIAPKIAKKKTDTGRSLVLSEFLDSLKASLQGRVAQRDPRQTHREQRERLRAGLYRVDSFQDGGKHCSIQSS